MTMLTFLSLFFCFLLITIFGYLLINLVDNNKLFFLEKITFGFLVGVGITTLAMFVANIFGYKYSYNHTFITLTILILGTLILNLIYKKRVVGLPNNKIFSLRSLNFVKKIFILTILALFASSLLHNLYWPIADWDALTLYDFRAKVFADTGYMGEVLNIHRYYLGYPLFTSLSHTIVYLMGYQNPHFVYSFFYLTFLIIFYYQLRRVTTNNASMLFTIVLGVSSEIYMHSTLAYTNLPYTIYYSLGVIYLLFWFKEKNNSYLLFSAVLIGLSGWIRSSEPFWVAPLVFVILASFLSKKFIDIFSYIVTILMFKLPWNWFLSQKFNESASNSWVFQGSVSANFFISRLFEVVGYLFANVIRKEIVLYMILISCLFLLKKVDKSVKFYFYIIILNLLIVFGGVYAYSFVYAKWVLVGDSVSRMSMIFKPLIIFLVPLFITSGKSLAKGRSEKNG